ncbi:hypothetical protein [Phocaeicola sp.]|jgi:hypothetical protein|uniref:hypothetical protein n=1 Tax=Phocaeicola sp. TaxID=2773926 RepID=UPI004028B9D6|nr:hypothetical protein [Phocaeicola vulgatus]
MKKICFNDKFGLTQAVLDGCKTITRRIVPFTYCEDKIHLSRYKVGEVVAIAQSYETVYHEQGLETLDMLVSGWKYSKGWRNKLFVRADFMTHHIRITDINVERLQDISDEDCLKEGIYEDSGDDEFPPSIFYEFDGNKDDGFDTPREAFAALIDKVSGKGTWESNPYVFVYVFELID